MHKKRGTTPLLTVAVLYNIAMFENLKAFEAQMWATVLPLLMVIFGALAHSTAQLKLARDKNEKFTVSDFIILFVIASFSGTVMGLFAPLVFDSPQLQVVAGAIGAFLGMAGVNRFANFFLDFFIYKTKNHEKHD